MKLGTILLEWVVTILLSIVAPIVVFSVATDHGVGEVPALLLSGIPPLVEIALTGLVRRRLDEIGTVVLILIVLSTAVALAGGGAQALLLRETVITGLYGLVLLATVPTSRPLTVLFGRRFATGGDPEKVAWWNGLWRYAGFRRTQRLMTAMWGSVLLAEAIIRAILVYRLPVATMVVINNVVPFVIIAALVVITIVWGRRAQAAGEARAAAMAASEPGPAPAA